MAIEKKKGSPYYYTRFSIAGIRVQESCRTTSKAEAQRYEEKRRRDIREQFVFGKKEEKTWLEAEKRWLIEMKHKRSILGDVSIFEFLKPFLNKLYLSEINKEVISNIIKYREHLGNKPATINRTLALIKSVLNKAQKDWDWIASIPFIKLKKENNARVRWLTREEVERLFKELPPHLALLVEFSLATGQRANNVCKMRWKDVNVDKKLWIIPKEDFKTNKVHPVPLNSTAIRILRACKDNHREYVFTYKTLPIKGCNTKAFRKALKRARIDNFRWHDLRHTWASWHVQNNTSLQTLQQLGGWADMSMVLRYAHLNPSHLLDAAENIIEENLNEKANEQLSTD